MKNTVAIAFAVYYLLDDDPSRLGFAELRHVVSEFLGDEMSDSELEVILQRSRQLSEIDLRSIRLSFSQPNK